MYTLMFYKKMKKVVCVIFCVAEFLLLHLDLIAQEKIVSSDYEYVINNNEITITDYVGKETELEIPDFLHGFRVTSIGDSAFKNKNLYGVNIHNSVVTIGEDAFYNNSLSSVSIPNSVTTIGEGAFEYNSLDSITISQSVEIIGKGAFCDNLLKNVIIPDSVVEIGENAFGWNDISCIILPLPIKEGYRFLHWQDSDGAEYPADTEIYHLGMGYKAIFEPLEME